MNVLTGFLLLTTFFIFFAVFPAAGQKLEVEKRIKVEDFPANSLEYLAKHYLSVDKVKYYQEISGDSLSFEAKFCLEKHRYSVEFFSDGHLMDVEKTVKFQALPATARERIQEKWRQDFSKARVRKCQEQTLGTRIRYEVEVRGKNDRKTADYQYLFEADGTFVNREVILQRPNDMTFY